MMQSSHRVVRDHEIPASKQTENKQRQTKRGEEIEETGPRSSVPSDRKKKRER